MRRWARFGTLLAGLAAVPALMTGADGQGFGVSVIVDGRPAPEYAARGRIYIEALQGREFVIRLSNPRSERVAVALSVDGRNVVDAGRTTALGATKWVLMPGQTIDIPGWQVSGQTARRFFFTQTARSYAHWLGDTANVGTIEAVFFRAKRRPPAVARKDSPVMPETRQEESLTAQDQGGVEGGVQSGISGGVPEREQAAGAPAPSAKNRKAAEADRFAATGIGAETSFPLEWVQFEEDPGSATRIAIRYEFREQLVRLGVFPREDDLSARENARGFSHEYAPDPYRRP
ncbi:MAG: hypothetical protein ABI968_09530 [Acidobacteriota bacterium]